MRQHGQSEEEQPEDGEENWAGFRFHYGWKFIVSFELCQFVPDETVVSM